jgi:CubicO group peptidase (beta-lactamase class C family)
MSLREHRHSPSRRQAALALLALPFGLAARAQVAPAAFAHAEQALQERLTDVESVAVLLRGRAVYEFYRDAAPDKLRDVQSVEKSALSALVGIALAGGQLRDLDQPVVSIVPEWAALNADPRAREITVRHLLTMTAGFDQKDAVGTPIKLPPPQAWARPLATAPGGKFAYDNSIIPMLGAVLERATGMPLPVYARRVLVEPLGMMEPSYQASLRLRTMDMARLGLLFLQNGAWDGKQLLSPDYVAAATRPQTDGGPPVAMPYGYMWWIVPGPAPARTFMASGYAGQLIWVHPPLDLVVAITSTVSPASQRRGHAIQLLRGGLLAAAESLHGSASR